MDANSLVTEVIVEKCSSTNLKVQGENATIKNEKENDVLKKVIAKKIWLRVKF